MVGGFVKPTSLRRISAQFLRLASKRTLSFAVLTIGAIVLTVLLRLVPAQSGGIANVYLFLGSIANNLIWIGIVFTVASSIFDMFLYLNNSEDDGSDILWRVNRPIEPDLPNDTARLSPDTETDDHGSASELPDTKMERLTTSSLRAVAARLRTEIVDLRKRANISLIIGISFAVVGFGLLAESTWPSAPIGWEAAAIRYVPRLALVVVVELFAYFFLGLYRLGISELKYYQNEITNVELWGLAYRQAVLSENQAAITRLSERLMRVERNFILRKGETTVAASQASADTEAATILTAINKLIAEAKTVPRKVASKQSKFSKAEAEST